MTQAHKTPITSSDDVTDALLSKLATQSPRFLKKNSRRRKRPSGIVPGYPLPPASPPLPETVAERERLLATFREGEVAASALEVASCLPVLTNL